MVARVKLVVDSTCDVPPEWLAKWEIPVLTVFMNIGGESFPDDGVSLPSAALYRKMAGSSSSPTTSAPSPGLAAQVIRQQLEKAEHVVVFTLSSKLSSVYNVARLAAEEVDPKRVTVVDSGQVSIALGWMVTAAAEAAERGEGPEEVIAAAMETKARARLICIVDTLEYLRRSGRVNGLIAGLGSLLQIKPIIEVRDGEVFTLQRVRTMSRAIQALVDIVHQESPLERLAIGGTNNAAGVEAFAALLTDVAPADMIRVEVTAALGVHTGPGVLGFSSVRKATTQN